MFDQEKGRLQRLLFATVGTYIFGWIIGLGLNAWLYNPRSLDLLINHPWIQWLYYASLFLGFAWIPLTLFLFVQGLVLRKKMTFHNYLGDQSVVSLSIVIPAIFVAIYIVTRLLY